MYILILYYIKSFKLFNNFKYLYFYNLFFHIYKYKNFLKKINNNYYYYNYHI